MIEITATGDTTLHTAGKYCPEDILVKVPEAGGIDLPTLTNEATSSELFSGKELIDDEGNVVTGTFTIDNELTTQDNLIAQIQTALQGKAAGSDPILQTKTVTPTTSAQNVTPDSGYDGLSKVTVNAIPSSYVKPTATKAATTYTPSTSNQTIAAGTYCSGAQTIKGDTNLIPDNIKSGVSIFGVSGSYSGGSGGGTSANVNTCTITFSTANPLSAPVYAVTRYVNGEIICTNGEFRSGESVQYNDVVCGSLLVALDQDWTCFTANYSNNIVVINSYIYPDCFIAVAPTESGSVGAIEFE